MAKTVLGVDIGHDQLKLALVKNGKLVKLAAVPMLENLMKEGRIVSRESMSELLRKCMKEKGIRANNGAYVVPNESVYVKNVEMPLMTIDQLEYNLPFEFNDYITGDSRDYVFDYAVLSEPELTEKEKKKLEKEEKKKREKAEKEKKKKKKKGEVEEIEPENPAPVETTPASAGAGGNQATEEEQEENETIELLAVCCGKPVLEDAAVVLRKSGVRMKVAAPALCSYITLLRLQREALQHIEEVGILDLGYSAIRMYMFRGDRQVASRILEVGLSSVDGVLADLYSVDVHLAHTYLMSNYDNCQEKPECISAYENIAVELMRAVNFYRFSNPGSALSDMWLCGGGAVIKPLATTIEEMLSLELHDASELIPDGDKFENCNSFVQAIGIALG